MSIERKEAEVLLSSAKKCMEAEDYDSVIYEADQVIAMPNVSEEDAARAWSFRGHAKYKHDEFSEALEAFDKVRSMPEAPDYLKKEALCMSAESNRGIEAEHHNEKMAKFNTLIEMEDVPAEFLVSAFMTRAIRRKEKHDLDGAIGEWTAIIDLPGATLETKVDALLDRAAVKDRKGDTEGAQEDRQTAFRMDEWAPEERAELVHAKGMLRAHLGDPAGAVEEFNTVEHMPDAPEDVKRRARESREKLS